MKTYITGMRSGDFTVFCRDARPDGKGIRAVKKDFSGEERVDRDYQISQAVMEVNGYYDVPENGLSELGTGA